MERNRIISALTAGIFLLSAVVLYSCGGGGLYGSGSTAPTAPGAFSLGSPADGAIAVGATPTLTWTPAARASQYRVQIDTTGTFAGPLDVNATVSAAMQNYIVSAGTVTAGTTYSWRVIAENIYGQSVAGPRTFSP